MPHKRWACALHSSAVLFAEQYILEIVPDQKMWSLYFLAFLTFTQVFHGGHSSVPSYLPTPSLWAQRCIPRAQTDGPLAAAAVNALCTCAFWDRGHRQGGTCSYTSSSHPGGHWECLCVSAASAPHVLGNLLVLCRPRGGMSSFHMLKNHLCPFL